MNPPPHVLVSPTMLCITLCCMSASVEDKKGRKDYKAGLCVCVFVCVS